MPESSTTAVSDVEWEDFDLRTFVLQVYASAETTGQIHDELELRVVRIEECIAARWPRRWLLFWRLAREIRASVAGYPTDLIPRDDFYGRRLQFASEEFVLGVHRPTRRADG